MISELLKLAALLVLGALLSFRLLASIPWQGYLFAALVLALARPAALAVAMLGTGLERREWVAAAWFGPKGFASVFFTLLILRAGVDPFRQMNHLLALVITLSILLHSSTDVIVARWFQSEEREAEEAV